jgi:type I restriction enzyme S subunit
MNTEILIERGWSYQKLNELGFVGRGKSRHRPRNDPSLYGGQYPFIQTADVKDADLYITNYSQTYNDKGLAQSKLWRPGTLCITIAANVAETAILKINACFPDSIVGFISNESKADVRFVKYYIETIKLKMQNISRGATQDNLSLEKIFSFDFFVPKVEEQRRIAAILSAYDDLIENNMRRIQVLEEMARGIYEEWFVQFRFPKHENVRMVESEFGVSPEGWKVQSVTRLIEFDPRTAVPREGAKPFVPMSSLAENSMLISNIESREGNSGSKFKNGDTLFARITPCLENGKTGFVDFLPNDEAVAFGSTEYIVLRSKTVTPEFVYLTARSERFRQHAIKSMSGATGRQRVRVDSFNEYLLAQPDKETLDRFSEVVSPTFKSISCLAKKNANLRRTRDLLLPKLISGEIDVEKFDG